MNPTLLISVNELAEQPQPVVIVDLGSEEEYLAGHIPGALHVPYADISGELPSTAGPLSEQLAFTRALARLGLTPDTLVIAYDHNDNAQACRFLWSLDLIEHSRYALLNGGFQAYLAGNQPVEQQPNPAPAAGPALHYSEQAPSVDMGYVLQHLQDPLVTIVDARSQAEYQGEDVRSQRGGHIPGAINLDYRRLFQPNQPGMLRSEAELAQIVEEAGIDLNQELICHCQTHRRSALVYFVLKLIGAQNVKAYPGSWAEWGNNLDTPIE